MSTLNLASRGVLGVVAILSIGLPCAAQTWRTDKYDSRWRPIQDKELTAQMRSNSKDAVALYWLWDRARYHDKQQTYFSTLQQLRKEQPKSAVLLAMHCAMLMDSNSLYGFGRYKFKVDPKEGTPSQLRLNLAKAKTLSPKLWLIYKTEANLALFDTPTPQGESMETFSAQSAIELARYAVKLAPHLSYTHEDLGYFLVSLEDAQKKPNTASIIEYKKAQKLLPVNCDPSFLLANVYRYNRPNKTELRNAESRVLATIPTGTELSPKLKDLLKKQGITPPTK